MLFGALGQGAPKRERLERRKNESKRSKVLEGGGLSYCCLTRKPYLTLMLFAGFLSHSISLSNFLSCPHSLSTPLGFSPLLPSISLALTSPLSKDSSCSGDRLVVRPSCAREQKQST